MPIQKSLEAYWGHLVVCEKIGIPLKNTNKIYKISDEVINFIKKTMKTWRAKLTTGVRSLCEAKIQRGIFQGDALSPFLFVIAMMTLNRTLVKCTGVYKLSKSQEEINDLIYVGDIKLFAKDEKELETNTSNENRHSGYRDGIWHRKMRHPSHEKRETTHDRWNRTTKSRKN